VRLEESIDVDVPRTVAWDYVTDPANYLDFMEGLTRWEVTGGVERGLGARYRILLHVGSADVGGLIEVVEWSPPGDMAWSSVTGIDQRGRWRLRDLPGGGTRITFRFAYGVAGGGVFGLISERFSRRWLRGNFKGTLRNVKRALEANDAEA
jgi:uncharacterized membrane protein